MMEPPFNVEAVAAQIHEFYVDRAEREGWPNDFPVPYDKLPEFMKADNRAAARRIGDVLALAGLRLASREGASWPDTEQQEIQELIEDNLELLAEGEHDGWVEARIREGWRLGQTKNIERREHPLLVPWSDFPDRVRTMQQQQGESAGDEQVTNQVGKEKQKDRDSVCNYVAIIEKTGYRIVQGERPEKSDG